MLKPATMLFLDEDSVRTIDPAPSAITLDLNVFGPALDPAPDTIVFDPVVERGRRGPPGPAGPAGGSGASYIDSTAGEPLMAHRAVFLRDSDGHALYASPLDDSADEVAGITINAADVGDPVRIQYFGDLSDDSFSFSPGPVFLGPSGQITQSPDDNGALVNLATAILPQRLVIALQQAVF